MRFQCPYCKGIVSAEASDMGTDVSCGYCQKIITIPAERTSPGAVIGDFVILRELGRGGMGVVYLAHQLSLDRPAALKILAENYANNSEFVVGFIKEARAAAKLNHPNIVQAYAVGEDEGIFYFAMEHVDGRTMKEVLAEKNILSVKESCSIIRQIAEALDYAWKEEKLVHRDIKPDNIMLTSSGRAKLADLGLAKVAGDVETDDGEEIMGTPQYISPEQLTGAVLDCRTDIYSLGATFYQFVTGRFPYIGESAMAITKQHLDGVLVPPREVNHDVPENVSGIIVKMMEKDPNRRYQSGSELAEDISQALRGESPAGSAPKAGGAFPKLKLNGASAAAAKVPSLQLKPPEKKEAPAKAPSLQLKTPETKAAPAKAPSLQLKTPETKAAPPPEVPKAEGVKAPSLQLKTPGKKEPPKTEPPKGGLQLKSPEKKEAHKTETSPAEEKKEEAPQKKGPKLKKKKSPEGSPLKKIIKLVLVLAFLLILGGVGGGVYFICFKKGDYKEIISKANEVTAKIHKEPSENQKALNSLLKELDETADDEEILKKCDEYFRKGYACTEEKEKGLLENVMKYYSGPDERRIEELRLQKFKELEKAKAEEMIRAAAQEKAKGEAAAREAEAARKAEYQKALEKINQEKAAKKAQELKKLQAEETAKFRPEFILIEKEYFDAYLDYVLDHDSQKYDDRCKAIVKRLAKAPAGAKEEAARIQGKWKTFETYLKRGRKFANVLWNSGSLNLSMIKFEHKACQYQIEKIENGIIVAQGTLIPGKVEIPLLSPDFKKIRRKTYTEVFTKIIAAAKIGDGIVSGYFQLGRIEDAKAHTVVPVADNAKPPAKAAAKAKSDAQLKELQQNLTFLIKSVKDCKDEAMLEKLKKICGNTPEYEALMR